MASLKFLAEKKAHTHTKQTQGKAEDARFRACHHAKMSPARARKRKLLSALLKPHQLGLWAATLFLSGCQTRRNEVSELANTLKKTGKTSSALRLPREALSQDPAKKPFAHWLVVSARPLLALQWITETLCSQDLFASGRSDSLLHPCLSSWQQRNLHTFETDENDPLPVMPRAQTRLQVSLEKREYHPNPDDSRHLLSPTDAPADLQPLHHGEQLCCLEQHPPRQTTLQPGSEPGTAGRSDSGLSRFGNWCLEVFPKNPSLPEGKGIQPLCLGGCQSRNWKVPFLHVRILKKRQQIQWKLCLRQFFTQSDCCFLNSPRWSGLLFAYKLKNIWNKNPSFTKTFRQKNKVSFLKNKRFYNIM